MNIHKRAGEVWVKRSALGIAAMLQIGCSLIFVSDVIEEFPKRTVHTWVELIAIVALVVGAVLAARELRELMARNLRVERELSAASGALQQVIEQHFDHWELSRAERDVALMSIKGVSNAEIARMRNTRDGTVKAQLAAIYRKAGVASRADLISAVIEDLIGGLSLTEQADN